MDWVMLIVALPIFILSVRKVLEPAPAPMTPPTAKLPRWVGYVGVVIGLVMIGQAVMR